MSQGNRTAADYAIDFQTLTTQSGWNDVSLKAMFQKSLNIESQTKHLANVKIVPFLNM